VSARPHAARRLLLVALGGTIACVPSPTGLVPRLPGAALVAHLGLPPGLELEAVDLLARTIVFPEDWRAIAAHIFARLDDFAGFVVTLGTDTLAYLAAALGVLLPNLPKPVVLTGAMRPIAQPGSDARRNLRAAVTVARSGAAGVFVAFDGLVIEGRRACKVRCDALRAFESINLPPIGRVGPRGLTWARPLPRPHGQPKLDRRLDPDVGLVKLGPQSGPADLKAPGRHRGLVVEGYGDGNVPGCLVPALSRLARDRVLVLRSQCTYGRLGHRYEGGAALLRAGALSAGELTTEATTVRLMAALGRTRSLAAARRWFVE
jgi:L-asparaginase